MNTRKVLADMLQIIKHKEEFAEMILIAITTFLNGLHISDKLGDKKVNSSYGYCSGYRKPRSIPEQVDILRQLFPCFDFVYEETIDNTIPINADGLYAIPTWQTFAPTYGKAVQIVFDKIKETRNGLFWNYLEGQLDFDRLRQTTRTAMMSRKLRKKAIGNIIIFPAQFGMCYRGYSANTARRKSSNTPDEFCLDTFTIGIMILTHRERLQCYDDLWIDCSGDEYYSANSNHCFDHALNFQFSVGRIRLGSRAISETDERSGSPTGFFR